MFLFGRNEAPIEEARFCNSSLTTSLISSRTLSLTVELGLGLVTKTKKRAQRAEGSAKDTRDKSTGGKIEAVSIYRYSTDFRLVDGLISIFPSRIYTSRARRM